MKTLYQEDIKELTEKVLDLIATTSVEIGHKTTDLIREKRFGRMTFNQVVDAFRQGVRFAEFEPFLNIRTFYKWTYAHKKVVDNATYQTETLNQKNVPFYQSQKLLK